MVYQAYRIVFLLKYKSLNPSLLKKIPTSELKGILFKVYLTIGNKEAYKRVNQRLECYLVKINASILEEGYIIRENTLQLIDRIKEEYENGMNE